MKRFSAKLLFEYPSTMEKNFYYKTRIITFLSENSEKACKFATKYGKDSAYEELDSGGTWWRICTFLGITDLLYLGLECDKCEVWYDFDTYSTKHKKHIPNKKAYWSSLEQNRKTYASDCMDE